MHNRIRRLGLSTRKSSFRNSCQRRCHSRLILENLEDRHLLAADLVISEIIASNDTGLRDADSDHPDWFEIFNAGDAAANLDGWYATDDPADLTKWQFPATTLDAGEFLVVFASDKDRSVANAELHTNFKLSAGGDYLAIVRADGATIEDDLHFQQQYTDISYGPEQKNLIYDYISAGSATKVLIPTSGAQDSTWKGVAFNDSAWTTRNMGVGFDVGGELSPLISANGNTSAMQGTNASAYVRSTFVIDGAVPELDFLDLNVNFDDGFIAYLNGTEVARSNAPATPAWNSSATQAHSGVLADISFENFSDEAVRSQFQVNGSAGWSNGVARITGSIPFQTGSTFLKNAIPFGADYTFSTSMKLDVHTEGGFQTDADGKGGQGMTFVLQSGSAFQLGTGARNLGLLEFGAPFLAIELDSFWDGLYDPDDALPSHIGIDTSKAGSIARVAVPKFNLGAPDTDPEYLWVDYNGATGVINVYLADTNVKPAAPTLSANVDLDDLFAGTPSLWAGWTASTDLAWNAHDVYSWQIQTTSPELGLATDTFDISSFQNLLQTGNNVLAIHGMNVNASDADFLVSASLSGVEKDVLFLESVKYFTDPTPGGTNGAGTAAPAAGVDFSVTGRAFINPFTLTLTPRTNSATIRYTLDGKVPNENSTLYTGPLSITQTSRVRAVAFVDGFAPSIPHTESFIQIGPELSSFEGGVFKSNLPLIVVDSFGNGAVHSDSRNLIPTSALFIDVNKETGMASILDEPEVAIQAGMRIRGQSSEGWPKKQYAFEAWADNVDLGVARVLAADASDQSISPFGLPNESDWVLNGPYSDKTQLNNHLTFGLYNDLGHYSPRTRLVEVFINSGAGAMDMATDYRGTYVLIEKIKLDADRVNLAPTVPDPEPGQDPRSVGGYIFKQDKDGAGDVNFSTTGHGGPAIPLKFVDPGQPTLAQKNWMTQFVNKAEEVLYGANWLDPDEGYRKYFDVDTFIDHWLVTELAKEIDGYRISEYFILDGNGKIAKGPAWDFNLSFSNGNYLTGGRTDGWYFSGISGAQYHWYHRLTDDPGFMSQLTERWFELRQTEFTKESLFSKIDGYVEQLTNGSPNYNNPTAAEGSNPISRNFKRWGTVNSYLWPNCFFGAWAATNANNSPAQCRQSPLPAEMSPDGQPNSYDDYVFIMKDFIENRLAWIDSELGLPTQFSPPGGQVNVGTQVTLSTDAAGKIFYTTDGTDPQNPTTVFTEHVVVPAGAPLKYIVPANATLIDACKSVGITLPNSQNCFMSPNYVLGTQGETWKDGSSGIGYGFAGNVNTNIQADAMGVNGSTYLRIPFEFTQAQKDAMTGVRLNVKYDDAFVAYLWFDGLSLPVEVARSNVSGASTAFPIRTIAFDAVATAGRADNLATQFEAVDISNRRQYLRVGTNYLVVQLLNESAANNNLLFDAELVYLTESIELPPNVIEYTAPITIAGNTVISARTYDEAANEWSSLTRETYFTSVPPVVVSELNYNPAPPSASEVIAGYLDGDEFEFIEVMNIGSQAYDLSGARFSEAISLGLPAGSSLAAGERGVIVRNQAAFTARYGAGVKILGSWQDSVDPIFSAKLSNSGERVVLTGAIGEPLMDFEYSDAWYPLTDGEGYSLTIVNPNADRSTWSASTSWRVSDTLGGTPGGSDAGVAPPTGSVIINELVAASSTNADAIEVRNTTANPVNLGNFFVTDDPTRPEKYRIAAGTIVPANGYLVLNTTNVTGGFSLSDRGGRIVIQAANAAGAHLGFRADRGFDAADPNVAEGVYTNSVGNVDFVPLTSATLGSANAGPTIGPLVVTEIMYNPQPGKPEWIELYNSSNQPLELGVERWSVAEAISYTFPNWTLEPHEYILLVQGNDGSNHATVASDFKAANSVPSSVDVFVYEPTLNGSLSNSGEDLSVGRSLGVNQPVIKTELIEYAVDAPWPLGTDGTGKSLVRINANTYGNEPTNWTAGPVGGTPGFANSSNIPGDLDGNGSLGVGDIDTIYTAMRSGQFDSRLDLDSSGAININDVGRWLNDAGSATIGTPYVFGDANLDGKVDAIDLNRVGINWITNVTSWGAGDFNGDGKVDVTDLNRVGTNWRHGTGAAARAPRAPLAAQVAVIPAETPIARSSRLATVSGTGLAQSHSRLDAQGEPVAKLRQRVASETRRERTRGTSDVNGDLTKVQGDTTFSDLADNVFSAW